MHINSRWPRPGAVRHIYVIRCHAVVLGRKQVMQNNSHHSMLDSIRGPTPRHRPHMPSDCSSVPAREQVELMLAMQGEESPPLPLVHADMTAPQAQQENTALAAAGLLSGDSRRVDARDGLLPSRTPSVTCRVANPEPELRSNTTTVACSDRRHHTRRRMQNGGQTQPYQISPPSKCLPQQKNRLCTFTTIPAPTVKGKQRTCSRVFSTSSGLVKTEDVRPAHTADSVCTPMTCGRKW
jgi:hypothetical protein